MSIEKQIKSITSKLIQKYDKTSWNIVLNEVFKNESWEFGLKTLLTEHSKGNSFEPSFKDLFSAFDSSKLKDISVVVVYPDATQELPEYNAKGVLIVRSPLTKGEGANYDDVWNLFINEMLSEIAYKTNKTIFVFVGDETERYKSIVRKNQFKVFVPKEPEFEMSKIHDNINDLLKRIDKDEISW